MKRWHVTLGLAMLAVGGIAVAGTVPVVGTAGLVAAALLRAPAPIAVVAAPVAAAPVVAHEVEPIAVVAVPMAVTSPRPAPAPEVREIHVAPERTIAPGIPELGEPSVAPRPRPVPVVLPDEPDGWDNCPACGMG